jgi:hypothetical protein
MPQSTNKIVLEATSLQKVEKLSRLARAFRKRHALLSQEGSAARRVARGEVPNPNLVGVRLWNLLSRDLDCVSITLSS